MSRCVRCFVCGLLFLFGTVAFASGVMQVQLPFFDGDYHLCKQNSDDSPTHGRTDGNAVSDNPQYTLYDLDFGIDVGTILVATADGTFTRGYDKKDGKLKGYGCYAKIDHGNGYWTMLGHTSGFIAQDGQHVVAGQPIAYSGGQVGVACSGTSTGPHVHVGVHNGSSTGISQKMDVWAYDQNTGELKFFATGKQGEQRDFTCWHQQPESSSAGHKYESRPIGDNAFSNFSCRKLSGTNGVLCWQNSPVDCVDGSDHVRYFKDSQGAMQSESNVDTWQWCLEDTGQSTDVFSFLEGGYGIGGDGGGSTPPPSTSLPDLQIEEITVHVTPEEGDSTRLTEEKSLMNLGQTYQTNVWPVSKEESCQNGNTTGNTDFTVKTDVFYKYARNEGEGNWQLLKRSETHCKYMDEDDSKKEMTAFTVPVDAAGKRLYLKAKVDATQGIAETDEDNNDSDVEWYPIQGACDLVITSGNLTKARLTLSQGEPYGFGTTVLNLGPDSCPSDTRLSYFYKKPGDTDWRYADGDDTPASKLLPNQSNEEWMTEDTLVADIPGTYQARICADTNNGNRETSEANNCFDFSYPVLAIVWKPDFIVSALWLAEGATIRSGTRVHPHCIVKNIGNAKPTKDMRLAYYINSNQYRDDDNVEANEMCVGCEQHEQVNNNNIKLGDRGTRSLMCCADYQGAVSELNEGNNCATIYFTVVK